MECRIFNFLEATLRFIAKTLDSGLDNLLVILHDIFCEQNNFYTSCTGAGACEDIADLTDGMGIEIYDDSTLWQVPFTLTIQFMHYINLFLVSRMPLPFSQTLLVRRILSVTIEPQIWGSFVRTLIPLGAAEVLES